MCDSSCTRADIAAVSTEGSCLQDTEVGPWLYEILSEIAVSPNPWIPRCLHMRETMVSVVLSALSAPELAECVRALGTCFDCLAKFKNRRTHLNAKGSTQRSRASAMS